MRVLIEELTSKVYLTPFTALSALMYHVLISKGIQVAGFCDKNARLHGESYENCMILDSCEIAKDNAEKVVIVCAYYTQIIPKLRQLGINRFITLDQVLTKNHVITSLNMIDKKRICELAPKQMLRLNHINHEIRKFILPEVALKKSSLVLSNVEFPITEKCTLRCGHCSNLVQYYKTPRHIEVEQVCSDFISLTKIVDFIRLLKIIGGEPFLHPELSKFLSFFSEYKENYGSFQLTTNGTVVPDDITMLMLKEADVYVQISNYCGLSVNCSKLVHKLDEFEIAYQLWDNIVWRDVMRIVDKNGIHDAHRVFCECTMPCNTVKNGRFYHCPFLAQGETLQVFPYDEKNHVVLDSVCKKEDIKSYIESDEYHPGCRYCSGYSKHNMIVPTAWQVREPIEYTRLG